MAKKATSKVGSSINSSSGFSTGGGLATAPASKPAAQPATVAAVKPAVTRDQIAKRAYEIWIAKGRVSGKDLENWQQAERELRGR